MASTTARPSIVGGEDGPTPPYPLRMAGDVISGFGRGSKELGIPTANLPVDAPQTPWITTLPSGIYFGYASLALPASHPDRHPAGPPGDGLSPTVYPMVMSIGYNPFYKNETRSAEVHLLAKFQDDFYGCPMRLLIAGFIREERGDYAGVDELVADIRFDCEVARKSLDRPGWAPSSAGLVGAVGVGREDGSLDVSWLLDVK